MMTLSLATFTVLKLWLVLSVTFLLLLAGLVYWYAYPTLKRMVLCSWCWRDAHLARFFPEAWSSSICVYHERMQEDLAMARRVRRRQQAQARAQNVLTSTPENTACLLLSKGETHAL